MALHINYANWFYTQSQRLNHRTALEVGGFDRSICYGPKDLDRAFVERNRAIFRKPRGGGYWLWKPYIILQSLEALAEGELLMYTDAGMYFVSSAEPLLEVFAEQDQDVMGVTISNIEKKWTKRDAFQIMDCDSPAFTDSPQFLSGYTLWRKSDTSIDFAREWLECMQDERLSTDLPNQLGQPNYPGFIEHRHDQSVFSLLMKQRGYEGYRPLHVSPEEEPRTFLNSPYPKLVQITRSNNVPGPNICRRTARWLIRHYSKRVA